MDVSVGFLLRILRDAVPACKEVNFWVLLDYFKLFVAEHISVTNFYQTFFQVF